MKRIPRVAAFVRFFLSIVLLLLLGLLYSSYLLLEERLLLLQERFDRLHQELITLRHAPLSPSVASSHQEGMVHEMEGGGENLLEEDPYLERVLPETLGADFQPTGVFRWGGLGIPHDFHPFNTWAHIREIRSRCEGFVGRRVTGQYERFAPDLALRIEERPTGPEGRPEFWIFLRPGVHWAPLKQSFFSQEILLADHFLQEHPVTASDFLFWVDAFRNPYVQLPGALSLAAAYRDLEEVRLIDPLTFVVRWQAEATEEGWRMRHGALSRTASMEPLPCWLFQYLPDGSKIIEEEGTDPYLMSSIWAEHFVQHWAQHIIPSCGPWAFASWEGEYLVLQRNPRYHDPYCALAEQLVLHFRQTPELIWQDFKEGKSDFVTGRLIGQNLMDLEQFMESKTYQQQAEGGEGILSVDFMDRVFRYIGWNQANPLFRSKRVRQALTMAIDRKRMIEQVCFGRGVELTGPLFPLDASYNHEIAPLPYDPAGARWILEEEGWIDATGEGVLSHASEEGSLSFVFRLIYYVKSSSQRELAESIAHFLSRIGVSCIPYGVDLPDLSVRFESKDFDAILLGWALGTVSPDPRQIWHSSGADQPGSSNAIGFRHPEVDALIEELTYEAREEKRVELYHRFHQIIHEEAPYTFLYVPLESLLLRARVQNVFVPVERKELFPDAEVTEPLSEYAYFAL